MTEKKFIKNLANKDGRLVVNDKRDSEIDKRDPFFDSDSMMKSRQAVLDEISTLTLGYSQKETERRNKKLETKDNQNKR